MDNDLDVIVLGDCVKFVRLLDRRGRRRCQKTKHRADGSVKGIMTSKLPKHGESQEVDKVKEGEGEVGGGNEVRRRQQEVTGGD